MEKSRIAKISKITRIGLFLNIQGYIICIIRSYVFSLELAKSSRYLRTSCL